MFKPIQFNPDVESMVRFVEETNPDDIVEKTYQLLKSGTPHSTLLRASTLAVVRSTEVPPQHHGGPLHPVCGVHAVSFVADRLEGEEAWLPIIQHVALCNNHAHSMQMGPYIMPECEPLPGRPGDIGSFHISDAILDEGMNEEQKKAAEGVNATKGAFFRSLRAMQAPAAEHYFLWLLENISRSDAIDQLLPLAISRNGLDDHNFLFPVYTARALDSIGWEWAHVLFRPVVRCQARRAPRLLRNNYDFDDVQELVKEYKLLEKGVPAQPTQDESGLILELGMTLGKNKNYLDNIEPMARAMADGLSLQGAGEALSIGAAAAYLSTSYGNPMDAHLHTGTNNRRYLLDQTDVSLENKLLGLLTAFTGPEVLLAERLLNWEDNLSRDITSGLPNRDQTELLEAITQSIEDQPWLDWRKIGVAQTVAPESVKETVALARQYADLGYDDRAYFRRLAEIACRDDFTEMHALKHFQAIVDEYYATSREHRWLHMVSAAKSAAIVHLGKEHRVYNRARELIAA